MAAVQGCITLLLTVSMLWASLLIAETRGQTTPCSIACPAVYIPVCGSDGRTYGNECELQRERSCRNPALFKRFNGECPVTTTPQCYTLCPAVYDPVCASNGRTYQNQCQLDNERRCGPDGSLSRLYNGECPQTTPCSTTCTADYRPVCGSNGVTYSNECRLENARRCIPDPTLYKLFDGECRQTTTPCRTPCTADYRPVCGSNGVTYSNECHLDNERRCGPDRTLYKLYDGKCPQTTTPCYRVCTADFRPVCGSNGVTYGNQCQLENARRCRDPRLYKLYDGECRQTTSPCYRACPTIYDPVCGSNGVTYSNECTLDNERRCRDPTLYKRYDGPCRSTTTQCELPCTFIYQPVCGSDGKTYPNQCAFNNERRCRNPYLTKLYDGECRDVKNCQKPCPKHHQPVCGSNWVTYDNYCLFEIACCELNIELKYTNAPCSSALTPAASTIMLLMALLGTGLLSGL